MSQTESKIDNPQARGIRTKLRIPLKDVCSLTWAPDGSKIAAAHADHGQITIVDSSTGEQVQSISTGSKQAYAVYWPNAGGVIGFCGRSFHGVWELESDRLRQLQREWACHCIAMGAEGEWIAVGGHGAPAILRSVKTGKELRDFEICHRLCGTRDGSRMAIIARNNKVRLVNPRSGAVLAESSLVAKDGHPAFSSSGDLLALCDGLSVRVHDGHTLDPIIELEGHVSDVASVAFSADGALLATCASDELRIWRTRDWRTLVTLPASFGQSGNGGWDAPLMFHPSDPVRLACADERGIYVCEVRLDEVDPDLIASQERYTTARVALTGDSGVGKTSLGWRLVFDEFVDRNSTHGQEFWPLPRMTRTRSDGATCEVILWDLAGQPDYRIVHALFVAEADVALLLFDAARRENPLDGAEYWRKAFARESGSCPAILVGSRADRGDSTFTDEELVAFAEEHGISGGFVRTSAADGAGIEGLVERLGEVIPWEDLLPTTTTVTFKRIKEFVLGLKSSQQRAADDLLIPLEQLEERVRREMDTPVKPREVEAAVSHLKQHGFVAVIVTADGTKSVLLVPELLSKLASSIVLAARSNPQGLGALDEDRLREVGYEFPELAGLDESTQMVLLDEVIRLFLASNLCFREEDSRRTRLLVFPSLINEKRPRDDDLELVHDYSYTVSGAVENVYAALVVLLGYTNHFTQQHRWQNHALYEMDPGELCGFEQIPSATGDVEFVLQFATATRAGTRDLFRALFERFLQQRDVAIVRYPAVACAACNYVQDRAQVVRRVDAERGFMHCAECGERIALPLVGEQLALSAAPQVTQDEHTARSRSRYESSLVRVQRLADRRGDARPSCFLSYAWGDPSHERWVERLARDLRSAGVDVLLDRWHSMTVGANIARFVTQMAEQEYVLFLGTPAALEKSDNGNPARAHVIAAERDLMEQRLTGTEEQKLSVLPALCAGEMTTALPPLLRGRVYADFRNEEEYFSVLFDLVLTLFRISFDDPSVQDLRDTLRGIHPGR